MIKVGVIGLGMMGRMHLAAWDKIRGARVTALADTDPKRASGDLSGGWSNLEGGVQALDLSRIRTTTDPLELTTFDDVDLVDICVPTPFHVDLALAALKAGKHVLCEKPMARTAADARRIARAAAKAPGFFMPAMCIRFWPEWRWLKEAVEKGTYGPVISASFRRVGARPPGWFINGEWSGGGALDLHLHDTDFVRYVFGEPRAVSSSGRVGPTGCVDHLLTHYQYDDVPVVSAEGSWMVAPTYPFDMRYTVVFEKATAEYRLDHPDHSLMLYGARKSRPIKCRGADGYQAEMAYLAQCIRTGTPPTVVTADDAAASIRVVEAEVKSVLTGRTVRV